RQPSWYACRVWCRAAVQPGSGSGRKFNSVHLLLVVDQVRVGPGVVGIEVGPGGVERVELADRAHELPAALRAVGLPAAPAQPHVRLTAGAHLADLPA